MLLKQNLTVLSFLFLQAKVANNGQIACGYSQTLREGVKLSLSAMVEGRSLNQGGHKVGMALDFEA